MLLYWFLVALMVITHARSQSPCNKPDYALANVDECQLYYDLLETALLKDSNNMYKLQLAFFPNGDARVVNQVKVDLLLTVDWYNNICPARDYGRRTFLYRDRSWSNSYTWRGGSSLAVIAARVLLTATMYEGIIWLAYVYSGAVYQQDTSGGYVNLTLDLGTRLSCNPDSESTKYVALHLLSWLKEYAVAHGKPESWDESNRGVLEDTDPNDHNNTYISVYHLILAIFVLSNISVMLAMVRVTPGVYSKLIDKVSGDSRLKRLYRTVYWGGTTVLLSLSTVLFLADACSYTFLLFHYYNIIIVPQFPRTWGVVIITKVVIYAVEMVTCIFICNKNKNGIDFPFSCFANLYCCCCCCCKCCSRNVKNQAVQTLALWGILSFVQHLSMSAIPISFLMILFPGEAFSLLATCLSALFCIIMLVSHVLYMGHVYGARANRRASVAMFVVQMFLIVSLLGVVIGIVLLYITMLGYGATFSGFGGWFVSLIPSAILTVIGWFVKMKLLQSTAERTPQDGNVNEEAGDRAAVDEQTSLV